VLKVTECIWAEGEWVDKIESSTCANAPNIFSFFFVTILLIDLTLETVYTKHCWLENAALCDFIINGKPVRAAHTYRVIY
jgi:hypothetical protein